MRPIDADALLKRLDDSIWYNVADFNEAWYAVDHAPTVVDAVPVQRGRWNCSDDVYESAVCSCCGWDTTEPWVHIKEWFQFCPHCGARMDGKDGDRNG